jgi:hypothetical protein
MDRSELARAGSERPADIRATATRAGRAADDRIAAHHELQHRQQVQIKRDVNAAVLDPPEHVREPIGDRPASRVRLAQQWQRLAVTIERHLAVATDAGGRSAQAPPSVTRRERR